MHAWSSASIQHAVHLHHSVHCVRDDLDTLLPISLRYIRYMVSAMKYGHFREIEAASGGGAFLIRHEIAHLMYPISGSVKSVDY